MTDEARFAGDVAAVPWQALVEGSPVALTVLDRDGSFAYANRCALDLYGATSIADLIGVPAIRFAPPEDRALVLDMFDAVLNGETVTGRPWRLRRAGGELRDVEINAARIAMGGRTVVQLELRDVSTRLAAERALIESERRWRALIEQSPVGIGLSDERGHFVAANRSLCTLLGRSLHQLVGRSAAEFTHPDDLETTVHSGSLITAAPGGVAHIEKRYVRPSGEVRWAWLTITHTGGPGGETWTLAHVQDVTDRRASEQAVIDSRADIRAVSEVIRQMQMGGDARQTIVDAGLQLVGASYLSLLEPLPGHHRLRVSASTAPRLVGTELAVDGSSVTADVYASGEPSFMADPFDHPGASHSLLALTDARSVYIVPIRSVDAVTGVMIVAWQGRIPDLDDRRVEAVTLLAHHAGVALRQAALVGELEAASLTDALTELPNRRRWVGDLSAALATAQRRGTPLTVALVDLDAFKAFNDDRGHLAGDELLRQLATTLRAALRDVDRVARWGGEEFAIALPDCSATAAAPVFERICESIPQGQTCSIGYATWDGQEDQPHLMGRVDEALYVAKRGGRNQARLAVSSDVLFDAGSH